jgi:hypothetical protein
VRDIAGLLITPERRPTPTTLCLAALAYVCLTLCCIHPTYIENDDLTIVDFVIRGFDVRYAGVLFTDLLHQLYLLARHVPWYGLALYAAHVLSLSLWFGLLWRVLRPTWLAALACLLLCAAYLVFLFYLNYTSASVMLCLAALGWLCVDLMEGRYGWRRLLGFGLVFMLGAWIRPQGAMGAVAYALPLLLLAVLAAPRGESAGIKLRRLAFAAALFCAPALVNYVIDAGLRIYTATPEQQAYDAFNAPRGRLQRLSRPAKKLIMDDKPLLTSVHWKRNDAVAFFNWNFLDERVYNPDTLGALLAGAPQATPDRAWVDETVLKGAHGRIPLLLLLASCLPFFAGTLRRRPLPALLGMALPFWCVAVTSYMYLLYSYTYRVELPYEMGFALVSLVLGATLLRDMASTRTQLLLTCAALAIMSYGCWRLVHSEYQNHRSVPGARMVLVRELQLLNNRYPGSTILMEPKAGLPLEKSSPLQMSSLRFTPIQLGWSTFSPRFYQQLGTLGIQHGYELVDALATHPDAYVICAPGWCRTLINHAGGGYTLEKVQTVRSTLSLYRLHRAAAAAPH